MHDSNADAPLNLRRELAAYVDDGSRFPGEPELGALDGLLSYLDDTYSEDVVLGLLAWRVLKATTSGTLSAYCSEPKRNGVLKAELARMERWALYLEGKGDPHANTPRSLWYGLTACFNPHDGSLEEWCVGMEVQVLAELRDRHGMAPDGEPPAIFN